MKILEQTGEITILQDNALGAIGVAAAISMSLFIAYPLIYLGTPIKVTNTTYLGLFFICLAIATFVLLKRKRKVVIKKESVGIEKSSLWGMSSKSYPAPKALELKYRMKGIYPLNLLLINSAKIRLDMPDASLWLFPQKQLHELGKQISTVIGIPFKDYYYH